MSVFAMVRKMNFKKPPYLLKNSQDLKKFLEKLGEFNTDAVHWPEDFVRNLPPALYSCTCSTGHHEIAPRPSIEGYDIAVKIYGEYRPKRLFGVPSFYLVRCKENVSAIIEVNMWTEKTRAFGKLRHHVSTEALDELCLDSAATFSRGGSKQCLLFKPISFEGH